MNNWSHENYAMQQGMGIPMMNVVHNAPLLPLPTPMYTATDVSPMNPPPPVPLQLLNQATHPDTTNQEDADDKTDKNDVSSKNNDKKKGSPDRSNSNQRRDRERDRSNHKSVERDPRVRSRGDKYDRNKSRFHREKLEKWNDKDTGFVAPVGVNMSGNMMVTTGMGSFQNMIPNNMMTSNMMHSMAGNMMMHQPMEQNQMSALMAQMNMMNNMMPNMMDQNMMINQQMVPMITNQPFFISTGVVLPPVPGVQIPSRREKPRGCRTIFIGGLPKGVTVDAINEIVQRFGPVENVKSPKNGAFYVRFERPECVEQSFLLSGYRFKLHNQLESEATTIFVDYALNREDQSEYEKQQRSREPTPPRVEPFSMAALTSLAEKLKSEEEFHNLAPTLAAWLARGECNKKNANAFYSLIQVSNNQIRRLFNEKVLLDDEYQSQKINFRDKFAHVLLQLEQIAKILSVAKHQRVSDHFTKQQRRNVDMWLKMTEEVENIKEEFQAMFNEEDTEKPAKNAVSIEKYEELKMENESLTYELEGYKNEAHLAKDEAERKFEKFKAHFIAQQALQNNSQIFPPLPNAVTPIPPPPVNEDKIDTKSPPVPPSDAKLISILTAFLMVHPLGVSIDYLTSYVKSMTPNVAQMDVQAILEKYEDVFQCKVTGIGATIDHKWSFATFDAIKGSH